MKKTFLLSIIISLSVFLLLTPVFIRLIAFLHPIVLAVLFFCILFLVYFINLYFRKETITLPYSVFLRILFFYTTALIILLFFRPTEQSYGSINLIPFATIKFYLSGKVNWLISFYNLAANIGLFIPYGIYLMVRNSSLPKLIFTSFLFISLIEILQFITKRGSMDIDDLILNMLGVLLGSLLYPIFKRIFKIYKQ